MLVKLCWCDPGAAWVKVADFVVKEDRSHRQRNHPLLPIRALPLWCPELPVAVKFGAVTPKDKRRWVGFLSIINFGLKPSFLVYLSPVLKHGVILKG